MKLVIFLLIIVGIWLFLGWGFSLDLNEIEKTDPKFREYLNKKYGW